MSKKNSKNPYIYIYIYICPKTCPHSFPQVRMMLFVADALFNDSEIAKGDINSLQSLQRFTVSENIVFTFADTVNIHFANCLFDGW